MGNTDRETPARGKVAKLIDRHDLDSIGDELEAQWTRASEDRKSLRELADVFNRRLLGRHLKHESVRECSKRD